MVYPVEIIPIQVGPSSEYAKGMRSWVVATLMFQALMCGIRFLDFHDIGGGLLMVVQVLVGWYGQNEDMNITYFCYWGVLCFASFVTGVIFGIMPLWDGIVELQLKDTLIRIMVPFSSFVGVLLSALIYRDFETYGPVRTDKIGNLLKSLAIIKHEDGEQMRLLGVKDFARGVAGSGPAGVPPSGWSGIYPPSGASLQQTSTNPFLTAQPQPSARDAVSGQAPQNGSHGGHGHVPQGSPGLGGGYNQQGSANGLAGLGAINPAAFGLAGLGAGLAAQQGVAQGAAWGQQQAGAVQQQAGQAAQQGRARAQQEALAAQQHAAQTAQEGHAWAQQQAGAAQQHAGEAAQRGQRWFGQAAQEGAQVGAAIHGHAQQYASQGQEAATQSQGQAQGFAGQVGAMFSGVSDQANVGAPQPAH